MPLELHEPICAVEAQQKAYRRGKKAYRDSLPCDPTQDDEVLNDCMFLSVEESAKVMGKWRLGWRDLENCFKPRFLCRSFKKMRESGADQVRKPK